MCSFKNVKKSLVLLCFRSKMLKNHWFYCVFAPKCWKTIGFIVLWLPKCRLLPMFFTVFAPPSLRKPYKVYQKLNFLIDECKSALFFQRKIFRLYKTILKFWLYWESSMNFEVVFSAAGPAVIFPSHALCVFLCTPLFEPKWEPLEVNFC